MTVVADPVVRVMGRGSAEAHVPGPGEICISITSTGESAARLHPGFVAVHRVTFDDGGHRVDDIRHVDPTRSITDAQADALAAFVLAHPTAPVIVVHCGMGVSRSAAVGRAIAGALRCPIHSAVSALHNRHVYVTVGRALHARRGSA